jgi:hypothetical protein
MRRQLAGYLKLVLAIALAMGTVLSPNSPMVSHDVAELAKVVSEQNIEIKKHGHAHEDMVDETHAYHGNAHDEAEHNHTSLFLPPRELSGILPPRRTTWALANTAAPDYRNFDLDRPPRV